MLVDNGVVLLLLLSVLFEPAPRSRVVAKQQHMMHDPWIARTQLDGGDVLVFRQLGRHYVAAEDVPAAGAEQEIVLWRQDQVRLAELPAPGEVARLRSVVQIARRG